VTQQSAQTAATGVTPAPPVAALEALPVLYQDEQLVVINKPAGLLVHRSPIDRHETRFAVQILRDQLGRHVYPVHRLDKGTSGALVFALDRDIARGLALQFAGREVSKSYIAVVRGWPDPEGEIDYPLPAVADDMLGPQPGVARAAVTRFRTIATVELPVRVDRYPTSRYALVQLEPLTGRRHQLRRHLAHARHPIVGDSTYGKGRHNRLFTERFGSQRLLLACTGLAFVHPRTGVRLAIDAPLAEAFVTLLTALGWPAPDPIH
jgi:tRNA pseudouridine65 synthase